MHSYPSPLWKLVCNLAGIFLLLSGCSDTKTPEEREITAKFERELDEAKTELSALEQEKLNCLDPDWKTVLIRLANKNSNCSRNLQKMLAENEDASRKSSDYATGTKVDGSDQKLGVNTQSRNGDLWKRRLPIASAAELALPYAGLALASYEDSAQVVTTSGIWSREISWSDLLRKGLVQNRSWTDENLDDLVAFLKKSGFSAAVYSHSGEYVLAYRGTDQLKKDFLDANISQFLDTSSNINIDRKFEVLYSNQYQWAPVLASIARNLYGDNLVLTGHSLGGGLAQYASIRTDNGLKVVTFNSAGMGNHLSEVDDVENIINFRTEGDPVSRIGDQKGAVQYDLPNSSPGEHAQSTPSYQLEGGLYDQHRMQTVIFALVMARNQH